MKNLDNEIYQFLDIDCKDWMLQEDEVIEQELT